MGAEYLPRTGATEENFSIAFEQLEPLRWNLHAELKTYLEQPEQTSNEIICKKAEPAHDKFGEALIYVMEDDRYSHFEKLLIIINMQKAENEMRIGALNGFLGEELIKPTDFSEFDKAIDDYKEPEEVDYDTWLEFHMDFFGKSLQADINVFTQHADKLYAKAASSGLKGLKNKAASFLNSDTARVAGAVALGVLIAKSLEKPS